MILQYRKPILLFSAIGNILAGLSALAMPEFHWQQLFAVMPDSSAIFPHILMYHYTFWAIVIVMGIAYWMTANTPNDNRVVLFLGGAGKLACALTWLVLFANGHGNWLMLGGTLYDGILGILFVMLFVAQKPVKNQLA